MRILILTQYFTPEVGAPQVRLSALVSELVRAGFDVEVVTALPNHPEGRIRSEYRRKLMVTDHDGPVRIHRVWLYAASGAGVKRIASYLSFTATSLLGLLRSKRPDAIFVESPPIFLMVPARLMAFVWRRPIILNVADLWPDSATQLGLLEEGPLLRVLLRFERWSYRRSHKVNAITEGVRRVLLEEKHVPAEKITFLPNGVDVTMFDDRSPTSDEIAKWNPNDALLIVYAGTIGYAHGVEVAVDAMSLVGARHPGARLLIVGAGSGLPLLRERVAATGVQNVELRDPVPVEAVAELYRVAVAGLSTLKDSPLFEGTRPSKIFPVMASGKPVIYSGAGEGARLVAEHDVGIVTPPEDAAALADAICWVIEHRDLAKAQGHRGRELMVREFSWSALIQRWLAQVAWDPRN